MKKLLWVVVVVAAAVGCDVPDTAPVAPGVTEANAKRVKEGMTLEQVERLLGPDGAEYVSDEKVVSIYWSDHPHSVSINFDLHKDGRLTARHSGIYTDSSGIEIDMAILKHDTEVGRKKLADRKQGKRIHATNCNDPDLGKFWTVAEAK